MKAFVCDRCGDLMERAPDNIVTVKEDNRSESTHYHHCDQCKPEVMLYCKGSETND